LESTYSTSHYFLQGGGEMGSLTRNFDWSQTTIGTPDEWPQSLRTTVAMILSSKFPMFLWWGDNLVQFYNDAYRPSLGNEGKHPLALGQNGEECWPEIWPIIYPLIRQVLDTGIATWSEDQLVPIYRNGKIEDVYWTFGYSPIRGETEHIEGVLVVCNETTEKVNTVNKLIESEKRFQNLIREATVGIIVLDEQMRVEIVNEAYGVLIERTSSELIGKNLFEVIPETAPHFRHILETVRVSGNAVYLYDHPYHVMVDGKKKEGFLNLIYQPYKETDGRITGVIALCQDVTPQVIARARLEEKEQQVRSLLESAPFPIAVYTGEEMKIELANKAIMDVWGKGYDVIGKLYSKVLPELESQQIFSQLEKVYQSGIAFTANNERLYLTVDGTLQPFYFNYTFTPLFDSNGQVYGIMNTAADVTDLNILTQKLEKSERNLRNTILQAPVAMCIFKGPNHIVELANSRMIDFWGKPENDVMFKPIFDAVPESRNQGFEKILDNVYKTGETFSANGIAVTLPRNGKLEDVYVNLIYEPYREAGGEVTGILTIVVDVTEQVIARHKIEEKVAERTEQLADVNKNLQKSNAELAQFAYIASHDLQEPIRKISTFGQMLADSIGGVADSKSMEYLKKINSSSARMQTLIRDVLTYSEVVKEKEEFSEVNLNRIIEQVHTDYELLIEQKHAVIFCEELPVIEAIPLQMSQLFGNLIGNSLKFSRKDINPEISISCKLLQLPEVEKISLDPIRQYFKITIADNGIGFKSEYSNQIFNIFQRLHRKSEYEGTGIGLAMCKKIALNHHGDLNAEGSSERGATINLFLPLKQ
jgi:PAS domain S-box-containing protein